MKTYLKQLAIAVLLCALSTHQAYSIRNISDMNCSLDTNLCPQDSFADKLMFFAEHLCDAKEGLTLSELDYNRKQSLISDENQTIDTTLLKAYKTDLDKTIKDIINDVAELEFIKTHLVLFVIANTNRLSGPEKDELINYANDFICDYQRLIERADELKVSLEQLYYNLLNRGTYHENTY